MKPGASQSAEGHGGGLLLLPPFWIHREGKSRGLISRKDPVLSYQEGELWPHRPPSAHSFHPNTLSPSQAVLACALAPIPIPACSSEGLWGTFSWSQHRSWAWSVLGDPFPQLSTKHWSYGPLCACGVLGEIFVKSWWKFLTLVSLTLNGMCLEQQFWLNAWNPPIEIHVKRLQCI